MQLKFRKKQYNSSVDADNGVIVFDQESKNIYVAGETYGPFAEMEVTEDITNSTAQQIPTATAVHDYVDSAIAAIAGEDKSGEKDTEKEESTPASYPEVILDETSTSVTIDTVKENTVYIYNQPLTSLHINNCVSSTLETTIYFSTDSVANFSYYFPQGMYTMTSINFSKGSSYCISIKDNIIVLDKIKPFLSDSTFIFSSSKLADGDFSKAPTIVEVDTANHTPIIDKTEPYTIYKFGEVTDITMKEIPANTLEIVVYFSVGATDASLHLYPEKDPLKLSTGSITKLSNGKFCMTIKDGVVIISKIKEI